MRIGVNTLFFIPGQVGGTEIFLRQSLIAMAQHFSDESLILFTNRENESLLYRDLAGFGNVSFVRLGFRASNRYVRIVREQVELPMRACRAGIDVLWSPGYTAPFFCGAVPQMVTIHDMQYKSYPDDLTFCKRMATGVLVRMAARRCQHIMAVSRFAKDEICKFTSATKKKVSVVHEAASLIFSRPLPDADDRITVMGIPSDRPFILAVSNTYPHKRMHLAVEVLARLERQMSLYLVVVGGARLGEPSLRRALSSLPDHRKYIRLEGLELEDMAALYQKAALLLFPSTYEGFGLPVLEALMAGLPVVASRSGSIPEVAGEHVVYVDRDAKAAGWADAARTVLDWTPECKKLWGAAARRHARTYSWFNTAKGIVSCCRTAAGKD